MSESSLRSHSRLWTQSVVSLLLVVVIIMMAFVTIVSSFQLNGGQPLYDPQNPHIQILADTNFTQEVYESAMNSGRIQLIQFYNSWCGHCISFAPTFKEMAKQLHLWRHVLAIRVVDCAQDMNTKLCRHMDINVYPTLKLYWFSPKPDDKGNQLQGISTHWHHWIGLHLSLIIVFMS
jgi:thiol-disulfide isomerase/thioredoxin